MSGLALVVFVAALAGLAFCIGVFYGTYWGKP